MLGVSFDSPEKNRAFREKFDFPFDLLCDTDRAMGMAYGAARSGRSWMASRISYLIDPQGRVHRVYPKVSPKRHAEQVLADIP